MPVDASGTPSTNFSIPKYLTSADAPSGKGLNSIVDYLDTLLAKGFAQLTAKGDIVYASAANTAARLPIGTTGQVLTVAAGLPSWATPGGVVAPATTLPASPTDKQQAILVDSTTAPTYAWLMQYSSAASKWIFVGGSPATSFVQATESVNSAVYVDCTTVGPSFTVPRAGDYIFHYGASHQLPAGSATLQGITSIKIGANATSDNDASTVKGTDTGSQLGLFNTVMTKKLTAAASDLCKVQYRGGVAVAGHAVERRFLTVIPVAVT